MGADEAGGGAFETESARVDLGGEHELSLVHRPRLLRVPLVHVRLDKHRAVAQKVGHIGHDACSPRAAHIRR